MSVTLEDNKRIAIAVKLADMKAMQNLLIANEKSLIAECPDREITNRLEGFLKDDQRNLGIIDNVIVQYGIKAEAKLAVQNEIEEVERMMEDTDLTLFEKVSKHELLKHTQAMSGVLVHKAGQVVGEDIAVAIAPLNTVNFENRGHEEQLKGIMESLSTMELTGSPSDNSLWSRVQDTIAALSGIAGSVINHTEHEANICDLLRLDHTKIYSLLSQIKATKEPQKLEEYFGQLYQDFSTHATAKESVVYPVVRNYYSDVQNLYDAQAKIKQTLDRIKAMNCEDTVAFKAAIDLLALDINDYVKEEESEMFPRIQSSFGNEQQKQLAVSFTEAKGKIQDLKLISASQ